MNNMVIRPFVDSDLSEILSLNAKSVHFLSPMDADRFALLKSQASLIWIGEKENEIVAFFIGFEADSSYDSTNFKWFDARFKKFLYIDRIVVSEKARSTGIGKSFYQKIENYAQNRGLHWLLAEVDVNPPNSGSLKFHDKQGFIEVGQQKPGLGDKVVSLRAKGLIQNF